jgi:hypothetical protein
MRRRDTEDEAPDPAALARRVRIRKAQVVIYTVASVGVFAWSWGEPLVGTMRILVGLLVFYLAARAFTFWMRYRDETRPRPYLGPTRFTFEDLPAPPGDKAGTPAPPGESKDG